MEGHQESEVRCEPTEIPQHVVDKLKSFSDALTDLEVALAPITREKSDVHFSRSAIDMAMVDVLAMFTNNSVHFAHFALRGEAPNDEFKIDMRRSGKYVKDLKQIIDRQKAPRIAKRAAANFVRNALWEIPERADDTAKDQPQEGGKRKKAENVAVPQKKKQRK